jgi:hypothetical protein
MMLREMWQFRPSLWECAGIGAVLLAVHLLTPVSMLLVVALLAVGVTASMYLAWRAARDAGGFDGR